MSQENSDSEEIKLPYMIPDEVNLETKEPIGGRKLCFTRKERSRLKNIHPPGIQLIGIKSIPDDLFRYHVKRKYFVRADHSSTRKGEKYKTERFNRCTQFTCDLKNINIYLSTQTIYCSLAPC